MKKVFLAALLFPASAFAFNALPVPTCPTATSSSSQAEMNKISACKADWVVSTAWNDNRGDIHGALRQCTAVMGRVLQEGNSDSPAFLCFYVSAAKGLIAGLGPVPIKPQ